MIQFAESPVVFDVVDEEVFRGLRDPSRDRRPGLDPSPRHHVRVETMGRANVELGSVLVEEHDRDVPRLHHLGHHFDRAREKRAQLRHLEERLGHERQIELHVDVADLVQVPVGAELRDEDAEILGEGDGDRGDGARLNDEKAGPAVKEANQR